MVILGGLELVAAGYLINRHSKNKREKRRLQEEEDALAEEEEALRLQQQQQYHAQNLNNGRNSHDRRHSRDRKHAHDGRKPSQEPPPQYLNAYAGHPSRPNSAPPPQAYAPPQAYPPPQEYPPTGWPAHWEQSQNPYPQTSYPSNHVDQNAYQYPQYQPPPSDPARSRKSHHNPDSRRGRPETRPSDRPGNLEVAGPSARNSHSNPTPHVRFAIPDESEGRYSPPPQYRP